MRTQIKLRQLPLLALVLLLSACGAKEAKKPPRTPEVGYVVLKTQDVPLEVVLGGRTNAYEISDVRPQVNGVIKARKFVEGGVVKQGQTLYEIDPSLYQAAVAQAAANLQNAEATRDAAVAKAARYKPLAAMEAVAKQDYTDAEAAAKQAIAQVAQNQAALDTAKINLKYTTVPAPITGRIGRSLVTTGALVTSGQTTALANIQRLDPIYVDITQSSADVVALRRALSSGGVTPSEATVQLTLEDGSPYALPGRIEFSETLVDQTTGSVTIRARFPNPQGLLLPGMFVRAKLSQVTARNAILVPQQGVSRDPRGNATVYLVGADNKAMLKAVSASRTVGTDWLVESGLAAGDKVIVEGLDRVKPNQPIKPVPAGSPPHRPQPGSGDNSGDRHRG
ncbi:efflux RND transporter periplasmic adaptor subunit [Phenylobacterium sp.]|uniref:efflux RND transporter periplasmic adaptor subunit n=1 Tax=Phenylobacterium sp. TaxID=1871053 RepID=UPI002E336AC0|nr:efflux RND transporter periplasmic adaptor subunit [Phenylobacterium sp.]HEX3367884.1 efflux RND transporter periplasmic adaptor subunit [Phenylobacterium sp.]